VPIENLESGVLPQNFADQFGWRELTDTVAAIYNRLSADEKAKACIFAGNYGEAGALEFFGPALGLPPVISGHNSYFLWGPGRCTGEVIIYLGDESPSGLELTFESVEYAGETDCTHCMPYENHKPIYLCRRIEQPLDEIWPQVKMFI
jgi:hypothetical protein